MKIGITGHQRLKDSADWAQVREQITRALDRAGRPLTGLSSLAIGADQMFAEAVLQQGGNIEVIIPFKGYELKFGDEPDRQAYQRLLDRASKVETLEKNGSDEEAYLEAGKRIVDLCDQMIAVWDGQPAAGLGGTADVVRYAGNRGKPIHVIDV